MPSPSPHLIAACAALALQGCAIVGSERANSGGSGVGYMLPRALVPVELVHEGGGLELRLGTPVPVGDTDHTYALQRSGNVFTSDNVVITVDPATALLSSLDVKSEDKSAAALVELVKGMKAESAPGSGEVVVFRGLLDPGYKAAVDEMAVAVNRAAAQYLIRLKKEGGCEAADMKAACALVADESQPVTAFGLSVDAAADGTRAQAEKARTQAECSTGFCYRINLPHVVTLTGSGSSRSALFMLPNRSPTFVMPLERWAFVKTTHDVKLDNGVFKSITTDRPSSAFAVASVPFDIAKGAVSAASELLQLKIDTSGKEKALADAKVAQIQAQAALDKAREDNKKAKDGTDGDKGKAEGSVGAGQPGAATLLSIRVGKTSPRDATQGLKRPDANPQEAKPPAGGASGNATSPGSSGGAGTRPTP